VRCPKCHAPLAGGSRRIPLASGGTALPEATSRGFPVVPSLIAGILVVAIGIFVATRGGRDKANAAPETEAVDETTVDDPETGPTNDPLLVADPVATGPAAPDPGAVAADVERDLKRQKLWMTASVSGNRLELRGSACSDPALSSTVASAAGRLRAAGLTKLRCLAQAGSVEMERDL
jgi:hypothetical protein